MPLSSTPTTMSRDPSVVFHADSARIPPGCALRKPLKAGNCGIVRGERRRDPVVRLDVLDPGVLAELLGLERAGAARRRVDHDRVVVDDLGAGGSRVLSDRGGFDG